MNEVTELYTGNPFDLQAYKQMKVMKMFDADGRETHLFPVNVLNVKGDIIGSAASKEEFINIWNADPHNQLTGKLGGAYNQFDFTIIIYRGENVSALLGNPQYELIDSDGEPLADFNNEIILYQ